MAKEMLQSVPFREAVKSAARLGLRLTYDPALKVFDAYDGQTGEWISPALDSLREVHTLLRGVAFAERRTKAILDEALSRIGR